MGSCLFGGKVLDVRTAVWEFYGQRVIQSMTIMGVFDKTIPRPLWATGVYLSHG